jgi:hypothetical protein
VRGVSSAAMNALFSAANLDLLGGSLHCVVSLLLNSICSMREILRKQIKEKDAMIDSLLARLNPTSSTFTPLSIIPSRLALTPEQRIAYRDVLAYYDKTAGSSKSIPDGSRKYDLSALDDDLDYESETEESSGVEDLQESTNALHIHPLPAVEAPSGLVAKTVLESRVGSPALSKEHSSSGSSQVEAASASEEGIGSLAYFEPGEKKLIFWNVRFSIRGSD